MILSQVEERVLQDLDRLVDWHEQNKPIDGLTVTHKQYNALRRIAKKKLDKDVYRRVGDLELTATHYRGLKFKLPEKPRRSRRNKDTGDMF